MGPSCRDPASQDVDRECMVAPCRYHMLDRQPRRRALGGGMCMAAGLRACMGLALLSLWALSGCKQTPQEQLPPKQALPDAVEAPAPASDIPPELHAGLEAAAYTQVLSSQGWLPLLDVSHCMHQPGTTNTSACRNIPGLAGCDAMASTCRLQYANASRDDGLELVVSAAGVQAGTVVLGALQSASPLALPVATQATVACPDADFSRFLQAFAAHPEQRVSLSAPLLRGRQVVEDEVSDESPRDGLVAAANGVVFLLGYRDGGFRLVDSAGQDQGPVTPVVTAQGADAYEISLPDDVEGIRYVFGRNKGCWQFQGSAPSSAAQVD